MVNRLRRLVEERAARDQVEALLADLVACTARHYATEEAFMSKFGYPDLHPHVSEHRSMITSLQGLRTMFVKGQQSMLVMVPLFLEGLVEAPHQRW